MMNCDPNWQAIIQTAYWTAWNFNA